MNDIKLRTTLLLALFALGPTGCDDSAPPAEEDALSPDLTPYDARGPFVVGYRRLEAPAAEGQPTLKVKVWYPAALAPEAAQQIDYGIEFKPTDWQGLVPAVVHGRAVLDAPFDASVEPRPLVIFSHGYSLNPEWYSELVEHFASKGFVVLAPEHAEADWLLAGAASFDRPSDVSRTIDLAQALSTTGGALAGLVNVERVAVVGHSYGGYTALAAAGARFDLAPFDERCAALAPDDPKVFLCVPFLDKEAMAAHAGLDAVPDGLWPAQGDSRVDAIVPIAGDAYLFNEAGLAGVTVPMMAIGGTMDSGTPWEWGAKLAYDHVGSAQKSLVAFEGADHMIPVDACEQLPFTAGIPEPFQAMICEDPAWDKAIARQWIRHYSTAFLLDVLAGDADARAALQPGAAVPNAPPGLVYSTIRP